MGRIEREERKRKREITDDDDSVRKYLITTEKWYGKLVHEIDFPYQDFYSFSRLSQKLEAGFSISYCLCIIFYLWKGSFLCTFIINNGLKKIQCLEFNTEAYLKLLAAYFMQTTIMDYLVLIVWMPVNASMKSWFNLRSSLVLWGANNWTISNQNMNSETIKIKSLLKMFS